MRFRVWMEHWWREDVRGPRNALWVFPIAGELQSLSVGAEMELEQVRPEAAVADKLESVPFRNSGKK